jgi:type VI secretion system protein ImpC
MQQSRRFVAARRGHLGPPRARSPFGGPMTYSTASLPSLRWLIAAPLTASPSGRVVPLADALDQLALSVVIDLGPAIGADGPRPTGVQFAKLRSFTRAGVLTATPLLNNLNALADRIAASTKIPRGRRRARRDRQDRRRRPAARRGRPDLRPEARPGARRITCPRGQPRPRRRRPRRRAAHEAPAPAAPPVDRTSAILDAIVQTSAPRPSASEADNTRTARERIAAAAARGADLALAEPAVRAREALWRDLKLVHEQCANRQGFSASVLDADPAIVARYLGQLAEDDPMARPDVVFLAHAADIETLPVLAEHAADALVPIVVSVPAASLGRADLGALAELPAADLPPAWADLRDDPNSRWLAAATNPVFHVRDGVRDILGDPALTLAAMMAASHRDTGGLASLARAGAFKAPLIADAPANGGDPPAPTEQLALLKTQGKLAGHGLIALGSPRTGESIVVAACPMVHAAEDTGSLPAQLLTGRIVRFALWVRAQIPPGAPAQAVQRLFSEAASVSLLPDLTRDEAAFSAIVDEANRQVMITARVHPAIAGAPLEIHFPLPLPGFG